MRLFLAIAPHPELNASLQQCQASLESSDWSLHLSLPEKLHLTLHFLGETPDNLLNDLHHDLAACAHRFRPFDLTCGGLGAFNSWEDPRVLWADVQDRAGKLKELFEATGRVLNSYRLFKLSENFKPHITLARVASLKESWQPTRLQALAPQWKNLGRFPVDEMRLMKSANGKYELLEIFRLM